MQIILFFSVLAGFLGICNGISMGNVHATKVENKEFHLSTTNIEKQIAGTINNPGIQSVDSQTAVDIANTQNNGKRYSKRISMGKVNATNIYNSEYKIKAQNVGTQIAGSINNPGIQSVDSQTAVDIANTQNNGNGRSKRISMGAVHATNVVNAEYHVTAQNVGTQVAGSINNPGIQSVDSQTAVDIANTQNNGKRYSKRISMGAVHATNIYNSEFDMKTQNVGTQIAGSISNPGIQSVDSQTAVDIANTQNNGKRSVLQSRNLMNINTQNAVNIKNFQNNLDKSKTSSQGEFNVGTMNAAKEVSFSSN